VCVLVIACTCVSDIRHSEYALGAASAVGRS